MMWQSMTRALNRLRFWRSDTLIGIEISALSVRLVVLERVGGRLYVKACDMAKFSDADDVSSVQTALAGLVAKHRVDLSKVAVVSNAPVMSRTIRLPSGLSDDDIDIHIRLDAEKYIPYPLDEVSFDFVVLDDDGDTAQVLLVAVRESAVDECVDVLSACGLSPNVFDVHQFALARALSPMMEGLQGRVLVVHIDEIKTQVYAADVQFSDFTGFDYHQEHLNAAAKPYQETDETEEGSLDLQDDQPNEPSDNQQKDNADTVGMDFDEFLAMYKHDDTKAASAKNAEGSAELSANESHAPDEYELRFDDLVADEQFLQENSANFSTNHQAKDHAHDINKIQKMIDSYEVNQRTTVDVVILSGLADDELAQALSLQINKTVMLADPFINMSVGRDGVWWGAQMAVACGAAMRADIGGVA